MSTLTQRLPTVKEASHQIGFADGKAGLAQVPSFYFRPNSIAWHAYNNGYRDGAHWRGAMTGTTPRYIEMPSSVMPRCAHCGALLLHDGRCSQGCV